MITLPDADSVGGPAAVSALRTGARPRPPINYSGMVSHKVAPELAALLRQGRAAPAPDESILPVMPEQLSPAPSVVEPVAPAVIAPSLEPAVAESEPVERKPQEVVLELNKVNGQTQSVNVKVGDKVRTIVIKRNETSN